MLLNFQRQFARQVWAGHKRQTIRAAGKRAHGPKVGEMAYCYTGLRTRSTVKLGAWPISRVEVLRMEVCLDGLSDVVLGADPIGWEGLSALAVADGFADDIAMEEWFVRNHPRGEFYGWVVGWNWSPGVEIVLPFESQKGGAA